MRSGFFNSEITGTDENGMPIFDRAEQADFFAKYFGSFVRDGVVPGSFEATSGSGKVTLSPGVVFIQGYFGWEAENTVLNITSSACTIAARLNLTERTIEIVQKNGLDLTPVRTGSIYELYLYTVITASGIISITDRRTDDTLCGRMGANNPMIYSGTAEPANDFGENGDIYVQY